MVRLCARLGMLVAVGLITFAIPSTASAQRRTAGTAALRDFLAEYKGKEILMLDKTTGVEQYVSGDANKAYSLMLNDVQADYFVVSRNTDTDKRTFVYPISVIRRIIYMYENVKYAKIVLEMY